MITTKQIFQSDFAQNMNFCMVYLYGIPVVVDNTSYFKKYDYHFFVPDHATEKLLQNQEVLKRISGKNSVRNKPQSWLRCNVFKEQPAHLSDLSFYERLYALLRAYDAKQKLVPKHELEEIYVFQVLKQ